MKRSEAIEKIVKESYTARSKALREAAKDSRFNDDSPIPAPAQTATAASAIASATAASASSGSATGGGGGNSTVFAKVMLLRKLFVNAIKGEKVLLTEKEKGDFDKGRPGGDYGYFPYPDEEKAEEAKAADADLEEMPIGEAVKEVPLIEEADVTLAKDPFPNIDEEGASGEEWVFEEEHVPIEEIAINKEPPGKQEVCAEGDYECKEEQDQLDQVYNVYEVDVTNPQSGDLILLKDNLEAVSGDAVGFPGK